jgi:hypothetical protein
VKQPLKNLPTHLGNDDKKVEDHRPITNRGPRERRVHQNHARIAPASIDTIEIPGKKRDTGMHRAHLYAKCNLVSEPSFEKISDE